LSKRNTWEKAILVAVKTGTAKEAEFNSSMQELAGLAEAAGAKVVATLTQARDKPHAATYIGKGKLQELEHLLAEKEPELLIFDSELSPTQLRKLEDKLQIKIVDRTLLILDIFGQRARSREGLLQVELASLEYRLPRLTGIGKELSRLGAGIGTRGAGEQKLELDRRHIRNRIQEIKRQMEKLEKTRELHKKQRRRAGYPVISLVGYTNAGKSSLFNALCQVAHSSGQPQVEANRRLFQTLDTTTRKIKLDSHYEVLITDTVGFIQNLPHHLVAAFRSTLEEAVAADLLLHVVDLADPAYLDKIKVVEGVLEELGAEKERIMPVFNKVDLLEGISPIQAPPNYVSARTGQGIEELLGQIKNRLEAIS
jgi:GTP-binding protein HflX